MLFSEPSSSGSDEPSPSHAVPASAAAAVDSPAAEPAADKVQREDWMTKSFPKMADLVALPEDEAAKQQVKTLRHELVTIELDVTQKGAADSGRFRRKLFGSICG